MGRVYDPNLVYMEALFTGSWVRFRADPDPDALSEDLVPWCPVCEFMHFQDESPMRVPATMYHPEVGYRCPEHADAEIRLFHSD